MTSKPTPHFIAIRMLDDKIEYRMLAKNKYNDYDDGGPPLLIHVVKDNSFKTNTRIVYFARQIGTTYSLGGQTYYGYRQVESNLVDLSPSDG